MTEFGVDNSFAPSLGAGTAAHEQARGSEITQALTYLRAVGPLPAYNIDRFFQFQLDNSALDTGLLKDGLYQDQTVRDAYTAVLNLQKYLSDATPTTSPLSFTPVLNSQPTQDHQEVYFTSPRVDNITVLWSTQTTDKTVPIRARYPNTKAVLERQDGTFLSLLPDTAGNYNVPLFAKPVADPNLGGPTAILLESPTGICPTPGAPLFSRCTGAASTVDTVLIIDSSGSMAWNDEHNQRHVAARAYLDATLHSDFLGAVDFDGAANTLNRVVEVGPNRQTLYNVLDDSNAEGGTNIGAGLQKGCEELIASTSSNRYKAAILLTDGEGTLGTEYNCFAQRGWPVYAFGFGQANGAQLQTIANATRGEYKRLETEDLACEFQLVRTKIGGGTIRPCATTQVNPGATTTLNQSVPINQERATFSASRPSGSDVVLSLRSPSGRTIDRTTSAADVVRNQGSTFESYSIARPESGTWQINLHGANVPSGGAQVVIGSSTVPAPAAAIPTAEAGGPYTATAGQPVTLDASGSRDQDGTIARYQWDVTGDGVFDSTTTVPTLAHTYTTTGTVTLTLKVTDNDGRVASDTATVTIQPPARQIDAYVRGNDMELYRRRFQNNAWGAWQAVTAMPGGAGSQPAIVAGANGQLDIFVRGTDNALHQRTFKNNVWSAWQSLSGGLQSDPVVVPGANGRIDVYVRANDMGLYRRTFQNNAWGAWQAVTAMPGAAGSQPAVVAGANGQLDIFVRGTDNALHQRTFKNNTWSAWQSLSGGLQSDPVVVPGANGRIDVYIRGNDMELYRRTFQNNAWGAWQAVTAMPGGAGSQPAVVAGPNGQLDIFVRGTDNALHQRTFKNNTWSAWQSLSGGLQSDPTVLSKE
ncbi:MAG: VWA domain-containing protein [Chloroflexi bacterium]|nr:VWA domain-containing protein [Chloroflexota bacterium]